MKRNVMVAVLLTIVLLITGCGRQLETGEVIDKMYQAPRTYIQYLHIGERINMIPRIEPARWKIRVQGINADGESIIEWWEVDETTYHRLGIGDSVQYGE